MNGPLRIMFSEIKAYADLQGFFPVKARELFHYIEALDTKWMAFVDELRAEEQEKMKRSRDDKTPAKPKAPKKS